MDKSVFFIWAHAYIICSLEKKQLCLTIAYKCFAGCTAFQSNKNLNSNGNLQINIL